MSFSEVAQWQGTRVGHRGADYEKLKKQKAEQCIALAERRLPGLRSAVDHLYTSTPLSYLDYTSTPEGSAYGLPDNVKGQLDDKLTVRMEAIINSMTKGERRNPDIIKGSRKKRIAMGSGTEIQDVNRLLKQFDQMQKMMKKVAGKGGLRKMMGNMKNMLPPGGFGRGGF
jgi:signal recognition particle GTPase